MRESEFNSANQAQSAASNNKVFIDSEKLNNEKAATDYILVVDDEKRVCEAIKSALENTGLPKLKIAFNSNQAIKLLNQQIPRAVILDVNLNNSEIDGIGLMAIIKKHFRKLPTIILTAHGNIYTAREAVTLGAFSFIEKPFYPEQLILLLNKALELDKLSQENAIYKRHNPFLDKIIGNSKPLINIITQVEQATKQRHKSFLLLGGHGTGKKTVAKRIHNIKRPGAQFVIFHITPNLSSSTIKQKLFGSDTNTNQNITIFDQAEKSSLYIENIELLPIEIMQILYNFLTNETINQQKYDINLILSSTLSIKELQDRTQQETFYEPLLKLLQNNLFHIPTLFQRKDDIPTIIQYLCKNFFKLQNNHRKSATFSDKAINFLSSLPWNKSNLNELQTFIHWILHTYIDKEVITAHDISSKLNSSTEVNMSSLLANPIFQKVFIAPQSMKEARMKFERIFLSIQFRIAGNNVKKTSELIHMERSALHRKISNLKLQEFYKNKSLLNDNNFLRYILNMDDKDTNYNEPNSSYDYDNTNHENTEDDKDKNNTTSSKSFAPAANNESNTPPSPTPPAIF